MQHVATGTSQLSSTASQSCNTTSCSGVLSFQGTLHVMARLNPHACGRTSKQSPSAVWLPPAPSTRCATHHHFSATAINCQAASTCVDVESAAMLCCAESLPKQRLLHCQATMSFLSPHPCSTHCQASNKVLLDSINTGLHN